ncbi:MAG: hypothetical protein ABL901_01010 [Hyphomicrobiaceae bacterium]
MGINSQAALNAPLPMSEDMIEAMASALWASFGSLLDHQRYDNGAGFADLPPYLQDDLRDAARNQAGFVVATLDPDEENPRVIEDRLLEIDEYLTAHDAEEEEDEPSEAASLDEVPA